MADLITADEAQLLLDEVAQNPPRVCIAWCGKAKDDCACYQAGVAVEALNDAAPDLARNTIALHAELAQARAEVAKLRAERDEFAEGARRWEIFCRGVMIEHDRLAAELAAANAREAGLRALLINRDGGSHDEDCRARRYANSDGLCNCGHDELAACKERLSRRSFPILKGEGASIDYQLVADHAEQARANHYQSVDRLAERGGLSWCELYAVLHNRKWEKMAVNDAMIACRALEAHYLAALAQAPAPTEEG